MYIEAVGTAGVSDSCGVVQPIVTNPIVALAPGELSVSYAANSTHSRYTS